MRWPWLAVGCPGACSPTGRGFGPSPAPIGDIASWRCDDCRRYLKAYDTRGATRPVLPNVDTIATLPLDAALVQQGYG